MSRQTVLILFGGESSEHDISIMSAGNIYAAIDSDAYDVLLGYIDRSGKWWLLDEWHETLDTISGEQLIAVPGTQSLMLMPSQKMVQVDVLFPVLHGKNGEDGTIQGLAQMLHIDYVGCGIEASAICMNKVQAKTIVSSHGFATADWVITTKETIDEAIGEVKRRLGNDAPWFVKPSKAGSSIGVSKVNELSQLEPAINVALQHDDAVLIERGIVGRELEVAVLGNPPHHTASGVGEIISGAEFYNYEDKYHENSSSQTVLDADIDSATKQQIRETAQAIYSVLGCRGLARVDFLMDEAGSFYFNEVNTMPGFTNISMYPKLWQQQGISYSELISQLILLARE
jgi:D-alanine-D-alanine ligase